MALSICRTTLVVVSLHAVSLTPGSESVADVQFLPARADTAATTPYSRDSSSFSTRRIQTNASAPPSFLTDSVERSFAIPPGVLGVTIGAVVGGVAGGVWSRGSCEQSRCNNASRDAVGGALIGAGVGLLIELAIRYSPFRL